jgi:hypothetical protein
VWFLRFADLVINGTSVGIGAATKYMGGILLLEAENLWYEKWIHLQVTGMAHKGVWVLISKSYGRDQWLVKHFLETEGFLY